MKKKIIIPIIIFIVLGIVGFIIWNNRTIASITLDINPSIKINLNKKRKIKNVIALNEDAKNIISDNLKGKSIDDAIETIVDNMVSKEYGIIDNSVTIVMHTKGIDSTEIKEKIRYNLNENNINSEIIIIENITKEDEKIAKEYGITPAKAAYINSIKEEIKNIPLDEFANKSVNELRETKETNSYCDDGYTLRAYSCEKEIERVPAKEGLICPKDYYEYNGVCHRETGPVETGNLVCNDDFELIDGVCIKKTIENSTVEYKCDKGELIKKGDLFLTGDTPNREKYYCVDKSTGEAPKLRCMISQSHLVINGKCYNGPAPLINGGCPGGDMPINGGCYSLDNEDQWECPDGQIYMKSKETVPALCPDTFTYTEPQIAGYKCEDGFELVDKKCVKTETHDPEKEYVCQEGYRNIEGGPCISDETTDKVQGYYCDYEHYNIIGNTCIVIEVTDAKHE